MKKCFWLLNHAPTEEQHKELEERFDVGGLVGMPDDFTEMWSHLPTGSEFHPELVDPWIDQMEAPDIAVVQGEHTYSFYVVDALRRKGVRCFSATTERSSREEVGENGEIKKIAIFKHAGFREYVTRP